MAAQKLLTAGKIGEAGLIDRIRKRAGLRGLGMKGLRHKILVGIGDDAAVFKMGGKLGVATTDTINEGTHFRFPWLSPFDVGFKAMEASVSDVGAMGGKPLFALASLILPAHFPVHDFDRLYDGLLSSARRHQLSIIGGNISSGENISVTITALGEVERKNLCLRSDAKAGDFIFASGPLGGSSAGLHLFEKRIKGFAKSKMAYRRPRADFKKLDGLFHSINAMEDASDGLASAVSHICMASKVQGIIYGPNIPITPETEHASAVLGISSLDLALYGGEDYILVYTAPEKFLRGMKGFLIGEIKEGRGAYLFRGGKEVPLHSGFDHFKIG